MVSSKATHYGLLRRIELRYGNIRQKISNIGVRMTLPQPIIQNFTQFIQKSSAIPYCIMFGAGFGYAASNGFWHHTPLIILSPFAYASYQIFVNKKEVINWSKRALKDDQIL